ncbi:class II aldolase [Thioclava sp. BHET1]|nr:class II aldolase [Thioclava sp. BHET1]
MLSGWVEAEAAALLSRFPDRGDAEALLALRVYTSRLIGRNPELAMHGGGNTSVKVMRDLGQGPKAVLHVKASGCDLATLEAAGLPGLRLSPLYPLRDGAGLDDVEMVRVLRSHLLDATAPNPSVETLLHAFLPARFVDHGHASAVLAIANQPEAEQRRIVRDLFGADIIFLPYVFPGFDLSVAGARAQADHPEAKGLWLANHGLFTWGDSARDSYEQFIDVVSKCETYLARAGAALPDIADASDVSDCAALCERLQDLLSQWPAFPDRVFLERRACPDLATSTVFDAAQRGTVTPDHVIRIKPFALRLDRHTQEAAIIEALEHFAATYRSYFEAYKALPPECPVMLDLAPRVIHIPEFGVIGIGRSPAEASINADLALQNLRVVQSAERLGRYSPLSRGEQFRIEYWELEQAKLR